MFRIRVIIVSRIRRHNDVTPEFIEAFQAAEARFLELAKEDDPRPNMKLLQRCEAMIRQRHPPDEAWWPNAAADDANARLSAIDEQPKSSAAP